ncbi:MAG: hypothetical protein K2X90_01185 [Candidatus Babeliaceae bacterium]|nr:hypothetical protein [Candidatus Babeliaceae bacterium]
MTIWLAFVLLACCVKTEISGSHEQLQKTIAWLKSEYESERKALRTSYFFLGTSACFAGLIAAKSFYTDGSEQEFPKPEHMWMAGIGIALGTVMSLHQLARSQEIDEHIKNLTYILEQKEGY